jgi:3-phenylpropionate/trans-cinnamate dioxygenase ferredoxin subunit
VGERIRLCGRDDLAPGTARRFEVGEHLIALVRIDDAYYAVGDTCSHENYSLSEGEVLAEECEIECWKHGSMFDLRTGEPKSLPATKPVPVYVVAVDGDDVTVDLP